MIRNVDLSKVTDNRIYTKNDVVNISCDGCKGCSECCKSVGDSIILDPYDMFNLSKATGRDFADLMEDVIEIRLIDNLILPNMMIDEEKGCKIITTPHDTFTVARLIYQSLPVRHFMKTV